MGRFKIEGVALIDPIYNLISGQENCQAPGDGSTLRANTSMAPTDISRVSHILIGVKQSRNFQLLDLELVLWRGRCSSFETIKRYIPNYEKENGANVIYIKCIERIRKLYIFHDRLQAWELLFIWNYSGHYRLVHIQIQTQNRTDTDLLH